MRIWRSLKNDTDLEAYAQLLRSLDVKKLNSSSYPNKMYQIYRIFCYKKYFSFRQ